jgi:hypothetical protein
MYDKSHEYKQTILKTMYDHTVKFQSQTCRGTIFEGLVCAQFTNL